MKKYFFKRFAAAIVVGMVCVAACAQFGVGADLRLAPWGGHEGDYEVLESRFIGSDIVANYKFELPKGFYLLPEVGFVYQSMYKTDMKDYWIYYTPLGGTAENKDYPDKPYQVGFDVTALAGYNLSRHWSVFTGPRYGYSFVSNPEWVSYRRHHFDWRIGLDYTIGKWSISAKCDIAFLKSQTNRHRIRQSTALVFGFRRQF